jgi:hypothetical protein
LVFTLGKDWRALMSDCGEDHSLAGQGTLQIRRKAAVRRLRPYAGRTASPALRIAQPRALRRKVSDEYTVPVCRLHYRELHRYGDEASWWTGVNIDPKPIALNLWRRSRPDKARGPNILEVFRVSDIVEP